MQITKESVTRIVARFSRSDIKVMAHTWEKRREPPVPRAMRVLAAPRKNMERGVDVVVSREALRGYCARMIREGTKEKPPSGASFVIETGPSGEVVGAVLRWTEK